jgi:hypothetical protein
MIRESPITGGRANRSSPSSPAARCRARRLEEKGGGAVPRGPRGPPSPEEARWRLGPDVFQLGFVARPRPRDGPESLADGFRPLAQTRQRSPKGLKPVRRLAPARRAPDTKPPRSSPGAPAAAGRLAQRQALCRRQELASAKAGRYHRGNCPGCGSAPIEACRKADGLRFVLDVTWYYYYRSSRCW